MGKPYTQSTIGPLATWGRIVVMAIGLAQPLPALAQAAPAAQAPALPPLPSLPPGLLAPGWSVEQQQAADFNADGRPDRVLVLQNQPGAGAPPAWPERELLVLLAQADGGWQVAARNRRLIPRAGAGNPGGLEDPLAGGELLAEDGGFTLRLAMVSGQGSYASRMIGYHFRPAPAGKAGPACWRLVRYERMDTHRASLATDDLAVDYLAGRVERTRGNAQSDQPGRTTTRRLAAPPRRCLDALGDAFLFTPP